MMDYKNSVELVDIVQKAKTGDRDAFAFLYTSYFTPIYKYIYFRIGNRADAEDLAQEVFLKAYKSFSSYVYRGISPLAYFYTIAKNSVIDHRVKKKSSVLDEEVLESVADDLDGPVENFERGEEAELVRKCLALLPAEQQEIIVLRLVQGLSAKEVGDMLSKSEESVRQIQSRGIKILRKYISHE